MKRTIVLGSNYTALGVCRALASEGIEVIHLSTEHFDIARFSRFVSRSIKAPSPTKESSKLLELLMNTKENWDGALLTPTSDSTVIFLSKNRQALAKRYIPAVQDWNVIERIIDKKSLYIQAHKIDIPTPKVVFPDSVQSLMERKKELSYPCIIKPHQTPRFASIFRKKVLIISSLEELIKRFNEVQHHELDVMVSEIIPGPDSDLYHYRSYIDNQGSILAEMCTKKLRQHPPDFGSACASKTIPMIYEIRDLALKLLRCFSYHGESSVEFKLDKRDNHYKLIEINTRPVLPELHFVAAGINFPLITYLDLVENIKTEKLVYDTDIYWIHNFTDTRKLLRNLRSRKISLNDYFLPYRKKKVFCVPFFDDPMPFLIMSFKRGMALARSFAERVYKQPFRLLRRRKQNANRY
jgi:predicted ATP-grasp superfamily ATP-dependent carboligase